MLDMIKHFFLTFFSGGLALVGLKILALTALLWFLWFIFFAKKNPKNPVWALLVILIGGLIFAGFIIGGIKIGNLFGFDEMGVFLGIFAFFFCARLWRFLTTPKEKRTKSFF